MGKLNAISLFSGIGGFELGLKQYCRTTLYCENDRHAQAVLLSRMADGRLDNAPICTDIKELTGEFIDIPIDIIFGGFPCQDISYSGQHGLGLDGERSGLFFEIVRLAREIKPTFLFLENVSAIRTRGLDRVIQELTTIGYDLRWTMLSAGDVGAKHKRERWFLLACSKSNAKERSNTEQDIETMSREQNEDYLSADYWQQEPEGIPRTTEDTEQRSERIKRLGNAVVPLQVKTAFEYLMGIIRPPVPIYVEYEEVDF